MKLAYKDDIPYVIRTKEEQKELDRLDKEVQERPWDKATYLRECKEREEILRSRIIRDPTSGPSVIGFNAEYPNLSTGVETPENKKYLYNVNYIEWLKRKRFIRQLYPWRKSEQNTYPVYALLVSFDKAYNEFMGPYGECEHHNEVVTPSIFKAYLKANGVEIFGQDMWNEWDKAKATYERRKVKMNSVKPNTLAIMDEFNLPDKLAIQFNPDVQSEVIYGKDAYVYRDNGKTYVHVKARSKRHFSGIKRKLGFMHVLEDKKDSGSFVWSPIAEEKMTEEWKKAIRDVVGLRKKKTFSEQALENLKKGMLSTRAKKGPTISKSAQSEGVFQ